MGYVAPHHLWEVPQMVRCPTMSSDEPRARCSPPGPAHSLSRAVTGLAAGVFERLARYRDGKPIHTRGAVYEMTIRRYGSSRRWGVPWLDEPGEDVGVGRLSRGVGLPSWLPDVLGLAVCFTGADGGRHDLLLSTTGVGRGARHLMLPRRDPVRSAYSTLAPYRGGGQEGDQHVLLMAYPRRRVPRPENPSGTPPGGPAPIRFVLAAATAWTAWDRFGILTLSRPSGLASADPPVSFDPVRHPLPGLRLPDGLAALRSATYAAARRGRLSAATGSPDHLAACPDASTPDLGRPSVRALGQVGA